MGKAAHASYKFLMDTRQTVVYNKQVIKLKVEWTNLQETKLYGCVLYVATGNTEWFCWYIVWGRGKGQYRVFGVGELFVWGGGESAEGWALDTSVTTTSYTYTYLSATITMLVMWPNLTLF